MRHLELLMVAVGFVGVTACRGDVQSPTSKESAAVSPAEGNAAPRTARPERQSLDLDDDGLADELVLKPTPMPDGPGEYNRLEAVLSRSGTHLIEGTWDPPLIEDYPLSDNLIDSHTFYVGRFERAGTLSFLFGGQYSCCLPSLEIYRVTRQGVEAYFRADQFRITRRLEATAKDVTLLEGVQWLSMGTGSSAPDAAES